MSSAKHSSEQIYRKLVAAEAFLAAGESLTATSRKLCVSSATLKRWRKLYRGMYAEQIENSMALAKQNRKLQRKLESQQVDGRMLLALGKC